VDRFCNAYTWWLREHLEEKDWRQFETMLNAPPESGTAVLSAGSSFLSLMQGTTGAEGVESG
jgi:hypothetical protein